MFQTQVNVTVFHNNEPTSEVRIAIANAIAKALEKFKVVKPENFEGLNVYLPKTMSIDVSK